MRRVSRDARLLFVQLWTIVDDAGRTPADPDDMAAVLYPGDVETPRYIQLWLDELEAEGCIESYDVEGIDYLRVGEKIDDGSPIVVTRETVLRDLRRIQNQAEADGAHPSALRSVALTAKIGLAPDKTGDSSGDEEMSLSPAVILGLPITGSIR